jgi:hypothetical protein
VKVSSLAERKNNDKGQLASCALHSVQINKIRKPDIHTKWHKSRETDSENNTVSKKWGGGGGGGEILTIDSRSSLVNSAFINELRQR